MPHYLPFHFSNQPYPLHSRTKVLKTGPEILVARPLAFKEVCSLS